MIKKKNGGNNKKRSVKEEIKKGERAECEKHITWQFCPTTAFKSHFGCGTTLNIHIHAHTHTHTSRFMLSPMLHLAAE